MRKQRLHLPAVCISMCKYRLQLPGVMYSVCQRSNKSLLCGGSGHGVSIDSATKCCYIQDGGAICWQECAVTGSAALMLCRYKLSPAGIGIDDTFFFPT